MTCGYSVPQLWRTGAVLASWMAATMKKPTISSGIAARQARKAAAAA